MRHREVRLEFDVYRSIGEVRAQDKIAAQGLDVLAQTFAKYGGMGTPETLAPELLSVVQANLLGAVEGDLRALLHSA